MIEANIKHAASVWYLRNHWAHCISISLGLLIWPHNLLTIWLAKLTGSSVGPSPQADPWSSTRANTWDVPWVSVHISPSLLEISLSSRSWLKLLKTLQTQRDLMWFSICSPQFHHWCYVFPAEISLRGDSLVEHESSQHFDFDRPNTPCLVSLYYCNGNIINYLKSRPGVNRILFVSGTGN
jgi:hypothetical protein